MKKWIYFFISFAILVLISFGSYFYFYRAEFMATALSRVFGVPVKIAKIHVSKKGLKLQDVIVYNPTECTMQPALAVTSVDIRLNPFELFGSLLGLNSLEIEKIRLRDPLFGIEMLSPDGAKNNWNMILSNIANSADKCSSSGKLEVEHLLLEDIVIELKNRFLGKGVKRPPVINRIDMAPSSNPVRSNLALLVFWTTKLSLTQIGQMVGLAEFTRSIEGVNPSKQNPQPLELISKKDKRVQKSG